jgi:predicted dehydrogenase
LTVGLIGCGSIGAKRAAALARRDELVGCCDLDAAAAARLARRRGGVVCATPQDLLSLAPEVVIVATVNDQLAALAEQALAAGAHVLVEAPAGASMAEVDRLIDCQRAARRAVKVGLNHRFHPAIERAAAEVHSGCHGALMHIRALYGNSGYPGYDREWRTEPASAGGGALIDRGVHLLDLSNWLAGPLALRSALLRTQFWEVQVEDNAALLLGTPSSQSGPWAMLHASWTEWKNLFSLEIFCLTAKLHVDGLAGPYGPQRLRIYRVGPDLGPPALEELHFPNRDCSWGAEWEHFAAAVAAADGRALLGDLRSARDAWEQVHAAYAVAGLAHSPGA